MKTVPLVPVLLVFLVVGIHVEQGLDRYHVGVGEDVLVTLRLGNTGESALDVSVVPGVPDGLLVLDPGVRTVNIPPGNSASVDYPVRGESPGQYAISSQVIYTDEEGRSRYIRCGDRNGRLLTVV
jgi:uncharacterized protein (DUF58 family)